MARKRRCQKCGADISSHPIDHFLCYECWRREFKSPMHRYPSPLRTGGNPLQMIGKKTNVSGTSPSSFIPDELDDLHSPMITGRNEIYEDRYRGTENDMGSHWDYEEFPPENL